MKPIIEVNHVWKEYQKGIDRRYKSLRDTLVGIPGRFFSEQKEKFWALEDIDFKVEAGESIGIIGRNGAGKSTLLKILSRITPPTKGEIVLRGRVASLLEVGTGFHPELTGRENVFFNGSILGMKNQEIKQKFDEIVNFSGVENFIDTPLKHYSSGMQMRLAFSVAAHLDSEILLIDEVLAVGDAGFQKKCIGKMDEVSKGEGKTIIFVSHEFKLLEKICRNAILIDNAKIALNTTTFEAIKEYENRTNLRVENTSSKINLLNNKQKKSKFGIQDVLICCNNKDTNEVFYGCKLQFKIKIIKQTNFINPEIGIVIKDSNGNLILGLNNNHLNKRIRLENKEALIIIEFQKFKIYRPGRYNFNLYFGDEDIEYEIIEDVGEILCTKVNFYNSLIPLDPKFNLIIDEEIDINF